MKENRSFPFLALSILLFLFLTQEHDPTYKISGNILDFFSGKGVGSGNISAIVVETGEKNTSYFSGNRFSIILSSNLDYSQNKFKIGILVNTSNKTGYSQLIIGVGSQKAQQTQACSVKKYHFRGIAIDEEGKLIENGKIKVSVESYTNSTQFSNGIWEIEISPCLIPGEVYNFKFLIEGNGKKGFFSINRMAK